MQKIIPQRTIIAAVYVTSNILNWNMSQLIQQGKVHVIMSIINELQGNLHFILGKKSF